MERKVVPIDTGTLTLTNRRVIFSGEKASRQFALSKIATIDPYLDGVGLSRTGKQKKEYYLGTDSLGVTATVTPDPGEEPFPETQVTWRLNGQEIRRIIERLLE